MKFNEIADEKALNKGKRFSQGIAADSKYTTGRPETSCSWGRENLLISSSKIFSGEAHRKPGGAASQTHMEGHSCAGQGFNGAVREVHSTGFPRKNNIQLQGMKLADGLQLWSLQDQPPFSSSSQKATSQDSA